MCTNINIIIIYICASLVHGVQRNKENSFKTFENNPDYQQSLLIKSFLKYSDELFSKDEKRGITEGKLNHNILNNGKFEPKNPQSSIYTTNFDMEDETRGHHSLESSLLSRDAIPRYNDNIGHYIVPRKIMLSNGDYVYKIEVPSLNLTEDKIRDLVGYIKNYEQMENSNQQKVNNKRSLGLHSEVRRCERRKKDKKKANVPLQEIEELERRIVLNFVDKHLENNPNLDMKSHPLLHRRRQVERFFKKLAKRRLRREKIRRFRNSFRLARNQLPFVCPRLRKNFNTMRPSVNAGKKGNCCLPAGMHRCSSIRPCDCAYSTEPLPAATTCPPLKLPPIPPPPPPRCPPYAFTPQPCPTTDACFSTTPKKASQCPVTICSGGVGAARNRKLKRRRARKRKRLQQPYLLFSE